MQASFTLEVGGHLIADQRALKRKKYGGPATRQEIGTSYEARNSHPQMRRRGAKRRGGADQAIEFLEQHHFLTASPYRARTRSAHAQPRVRQKSSECQNLRYFSEYFRLHKKNSLRGAGPRLIFAHGTFI